LLHNPRNLSQLHLEEPSKTSLEKKKQHYKITPFLLIASLCFFIFLVVFVFVFCFIEWNVHGVNSFTEKKEN